MGYLWILFIHMQICPFYNTLLSINFFTLDSSAKFIVSRRCWDFASASDEIFEQKFFKFSLQWHHRGQWEISKQLYWSVLWYDETESRKGMVIQVVKMVHWVSDCSLFGFLVAVTISLLLASNAVYENKQKWGKRLY